MRRLRPLRPVALAHSDNIGRQRPSLPVLSPSMPERRKVTVHMAAEAPPTWDPLSIVVRRAVTMVVFVIAGLAFAFGFGNGWQLGLALGVPGWIAPLVAPAVDLSVVTLLAAIQFIRAHGLGGHLAGPRLLLIVCGLITFALNTTRSILTAQFGRAAFDAVAPLLLIGWSEVGPRLLSMLHRIVEDEPTSVPARPGPLPDGVGTVPDRPVLPPDLLARARAADQTHRAESGKCITRDALRKHLRISNAVAGALLHELRLLPDVGQPEIDVGEQHDTHSPK